MRIKQHTVGVVYMIGSDESPAVSGTDVMQVIIPCVAIPVLVGVFLLIIHLCRRRHRASAAGVPNKLPQATRRQHGAPPVTANNAVGLCSEVCIIFCSIGSNFLAHDTRSGKCAILLWIVGGCISPFACPEPVGWYADKFVTRRQCDARRMSKKEQLLSQPQKHFITTSIPCSV